MKKPVHIKGIDGVKKFDNLFDAIQYQKTTPAGLYWLKTPVIVLRDNKYKRTK